MTMTREQIEKYLRRIVRLSPRLVRDYMTKPDAELAEIVKAYATERRDGM
jgi:hypothetical protein